MNVIPTPQSALVIGSDTRAFLGVVRSLGRQGVAVDVAPFDFSSVALSSRYIRSVRRLPPLQLDPEVWFKALLQLCEETHPDFIVPCDDRSIIPLHEFRERTTHLRIGMPGERAFQTFFDKGDTRAMAQACGVPVPTGRVLAAGDTAESLVAEFGLPLFLKPRNSYLLRALDVRRNVSACRSLLDLQTALSHIEHRAEALHEYLVETSFQGVGVGVSVLARQGVVSQAFQHRRVREPVGGGGSSYRKSEAVSPDLEAMTLALCKASQLEGVAMFEYKVDDSTGQKALLEVNSRFWGSLPLAMAAGVDFPHLWFSQAQGAAPAARIAYRVPCYARNLLSDLYATLGHIESRKSEGLAVMAWEALRWTASFGRLLVGRESLDTLARDDLRPGWLEIRSIGGKVLERLSRHAPGTQDRRKRAIQQTLAEAWADARREGRPVRVVVACFGNICRSPYAALRLTNALQGGDVPVTVTGAALGARPSRPSPGRAVAAAARAGIDLAPHQSRYGDDELLQQADLVLVFDSANLALLETRGLKLRREALRMRELLGLQAPAEVGNGDIADPVDGGDAFFDRTYQLIDRTVLALQRAVPVALR